MIAGQAVPISINTFCDIFNSNYPIHSIVNIGKEFSKNFLGVLGLKKYAMHEKNDLIKISTLNDGQKVYEFMRFDTHWKGVGRGADANGLANSISQQVLERLKNREGYMVVYTHLGKNAGNQEPIPKETRNALRNLADEFKNGAIFVTSTSKLLKYYLHNRYLYWSHEFKNNELHIHIQKIKEPISGERIPTLKDLTGITFYISDRKIARVFVNKKELKNIKRNAADYTGRESITL
jgi:hypothetical protein